MIDAPDLGPAILDTGALVAALDRTDGHHAWAVATLPRLRAPLATCEPVLTEALWLLRRQAPAHDAVFDWLDRGLLLVPFDARPESASLRRLLQKYRDVPMSFTDACLVRMAELLPDHAVCTLDRDFRVYRMHSRDPLRLVLPDDV